MERQGQNRELEVITFGCRLNTVESEVIREHAASAGLQDAVVFNTCAVTGEAVRQARQAIRRARRERPHARIIVTGCAAQTETARFAEMGEVDLVLGNAEKLKPESYGEIGERIRVNDIFEARETAGHLVEGFEGRTRAFVQVQNGCDHRCTFCIIPYGRGDSRSVPMGPVIDQVRRLAGKDYPEVVLTGVDMTAWGADLPGRPRLGTLVRAVLRHVPELKRLRLSSIDSVEADEDLMRAIAEEERLMPHLHLSLQAGDDMILKRMKRRHLRADAVRFCEEARRLRPDIVFGADLIAGFPTEDAAMHAANLSIVRDLGIVHGHVFPYSPRPGTPAARMPQLDKAAIRGRAAELRAEVASVREAWLASLVGRPLDVLAETDGTGHAGNFARVAVPAGTAPGEIVTVVPRRVEGGLLQ